ncbi:MAG TPA: acyl-CoA dehydrogenase [Thermoanaerobaculia bacterium]|nr:acyl-CoA dehydrogenase [Thermoanaerobaculia bacterium]
MLFRWLLSTVRRRGLLPRISATERQALEAGTVWVERELFTGKPDLDRLAALPYPELTDAERAFLEGPVEEVCRKVDPWRLGQERALPEEVWAYLREHRFFGLAIPPEHGGLGFSALAQSTVFAKLASRSLALSAIVLIPNSVGPGELLVEYGTPEQQERWLPRLARGEEIPCFALTEPSAGSDAASLTSRGVVFRGDDGEPAIRLDWEKRYITLAPVATLVGLAFRLYDPEGLLGEVEDGEGDLGITVALVPTSLPGVEVGRRHDPMGLALPNGPTRGRGVVVPLDAIVGGPAQAGRGWKMLMEALAGGRAISLPAQSVGGAKVVARVAGAYAGVREQFGVPIARFEGIEEKLARIAGLAYLMDACRVVTCGAVDAGERPAVVSALMKYRQTELGREVVADGMDVLAGAALMRGPKNPLADGWEAAPIGITVEGANVLTRTLIAFGQGAIRSHPYLGRAMAAAEADDPGELRRAVLGGLGAYVGHLLRTTWLDWTGARFVAAPGDRALRRSWQRLAWAASRFALLADTALAGYGPQIKLREKLSGRFADALSWMLAAACVLRRHEAEGRRPEDLPLARWAAGHALAETQRALDGVAANFDAAPLGWWVRGLLRPWWRLAPLALPPTDRLGAEVAAAITEPGERRDRLTADLFTTADPLDARGRIEHAFELAVRSRPARDKLRRAVKAGEVPAGPAAEIAAAAERAGVLDAHEVRLIVEAAAARRRATDVDEFSAEEYLGRAETDPPPDTTPETATHRES